jgi:hypothetical protein
LLVHNSGELPHHLVRCMRVVRHWCHRILQAPREAILTTGRSMCQVCSHPARDEIDRQLVAGVSLRQLARQYETDKSALCRHKAHVSGAIAEARAEELATNAGRLSDQVHEQVDRCRRLVLQAERILDGAADPKLALRAAEATCRPLRELRGYLELLGELTGEISRRGATAVAVAGAQASAEVSEVEQLKSLTDDELLEELEDQAAIVRARIAARKGETSC